MSKKKKKLPGDQGENALHFPSVQPGMPLQTMKAAKTDPLGSYTGNPVDDDVPVQDADDL